MLKYCYEEISGEKYLIPDKVIGVVELLTMELRNKIEEVYCMPNIVDRFGLLEVYREIKSIDTDADIISFIDSIFDDEENEYNLAWIHQYSTDFKQLLKDVSYGYYPHLVDDNMKHIVRNLVTKGIVPKYCCGGHGDQTLVAPYISILGFYRFGEIKRINEKLGLDLDINEYDDGFAIRGKMSISNDYIRNWKMANRFIESLTRLVEML